ncbi:MAG: glutamine amidotransferase [Sediminicola sp.]|jgi:glutamine amidotransferase
MKKTVVIIDYQLGNLFSVNQALVNIGLDVLISSDPKDIERADAIVLPGVGAFGNAMTNLNKLGLSQPIKDFVLGGKPFLGICLGLQLLFSTSEEFGASEGLDLIKGKVKRFSNEVKSKTIRVPQIAWNTIEKPQKDRWERTPLEKIRENEHMYFVHSYYVAPDDESVVLTTTTYGGMSYVSSIFKKNIFACQFHPEKSASEGLKIYREWAVQNQLISI